MTPSAAFFLALSVLFGTPEAAFRARVYTTLAKMCPATPGPRLARYAEVVADVALEQDDPDHTAALFLGVGAHETCFATEVQHGGPAVGAWQVEPRRDGVREAILANPHEAARAALRVLDACRGSLRCYAGARHNARGNAVTAQLEACVAVAEKGMRQENGVGPCRSWHRETKKAKGKQHAGPPHTHRR